MSIANKESLIEFADKENPQASATLNSCINDGCNDINISKVEQYLRVISNKLNLSNMVNYK